MKNQRDKLTNRIVWEQGENNMESYRIPGTIVTNNNSLLVFAEARPDGGDETPKSIVLKRSTDKGLSWSPTIYIEKHDGTYWKQHQDQIDKEDYPDKKEVWTNPAPLIDKETGRIFLFYALSEGSIKEQNLQRYTKIFYKYSDDDGINWTDRVEITSLLNHTLNGEPLEDENGFPCDHLGRAFHMPGPGHGIQLTDGRLLLHFWNRRAIGILNGPEIPVNERKYGVCTIYSDDHGETWQYGSSFGHDQNLNESRILELDNGDIYLNGRYKSERINHRMTAVSHDKGKNWNDIKVDQSFPLSHQCDAGLVRLSWPREGKNRILYSKNESPQGRKNLVIRLSYDEGKTWHCVKTIDPGSAGYSDITVLPAKSFNKITDKTIIVIYESGKSLRCAVFSK